LLTAAAHARAGPARPAAVLRLRPALLERRGPARPAARAAQVAARYRVRQTTRAWPAAARRPDPQPEQHAARARLQPAPRRAGREEGRLALHRRALRRLAQGQVPP